MQSGGLSYSKNFSRFARIKDASKDALAAFELASSVRVEIGARPLALASDPNVEK